MKLVRPAWLAVAGVVVLLAVLVPYQMDEYVMYHVLACHQPPQTMNVWREACDAYPTTWGPLQFERSYRYIGITSSLVYAPFHLLWNSSWMNVAVGAGFLVAQAVGLAKSWQLSTRAIPVLAAFFPLAFAAVHDAGPTRISMTALAWTPYLVRRVATGSWAWAVVVVAAWLLATEDKPFFLYLTPGIAVLTLTALSIPSGTVARRSALRASAVLGVAGAACLVMLATMNVGRVSYLNYLRYSTPAATDGVNPLQAVRDAVLFTLDWPFYGHRLNDYSAAGGVLVPHDSPGYGRGPLAMTVVVVLLLTLGYYLATKREWSAGGGRRRQNLMLLASWLTLSVGAAVAGGWASHHFVFAQAPLAVVLVRWLLDLPNSWASNTLLVGTALASLAIATTPIYPQHSRDVSVAVSTVVAEAGPNDVINCASWGCYYTYSLRNPRDIPVVFADTAEAAAELANTVATRAAAIYELCVSCRIGDVAQRYPDALIRQIPVGTGQWSLFLVRPTAS